MATVTQTESATYVMGKGPDSEQIKFSLRLTGAYFVQIYFRREDQAAWPPKGLGWYAFEVTDRVSEKPFNAALEKVKDLANRILALPKARYQQFFTALEAKKATFPEDSYLPLKLIEEALGG